MPTGSSEGWALVWEGSLTTGLLLLADVICVRLGHQNGTDTLIWGDSPQLTEARIKGPLEMGPL